MIAITWQVTSRASRASRRPLSHRSSCSRRTNPIEDDMLLRVGRRGRNRGEFVNPQVEKKILFFVIFSSCLIT